MEVGIYKDVLDKTEDAKLRISELKGFDYAASMAVQSRSMSS